MDPIPIPDIEDRLFAIETQLTLLMAMHLPLEKLEAYAKQERDASEAILTPSADVGLLPSARTPEAVSRAYRRLAEARLFEMAAHEAATARKRRMTEATS